MRFVRFGSWLSLLLDGGLLACGGGGSVRKTNMHQDVRPQDNVKSKSNPRKGVWVMKAVGSLVRSRQWGLLGLLALLLASCGPEQSNTGATLTVNRVGNGTVVGQGINCGVDCSETYASAVEVTLVAEPASGFGFAGWSGCNETTGAQCVVQMDRSKTITATFTQEPPGGATLTVTLQGEGEGSVGSDPPGIACGQDCTETFVQGVMVSLTAMPASGSVFAGWSGACSGTGTCDVAMDADRTITATFELEPVGGTGTLRIVVEGLPDDDEDGQPDIAANVAVIGPDDFYRVLTESTTLTDLAPGIYSIRSGNATGNNTTYVGTPVTQERTLPSADNQVTVTYGNFALPAALPVSSDCGGVPVGTSCTITVALVNNDLSWGGLSVATRGAGHFEYISHVRGDLLTGACGLSANQGATGDVLAAASSCGKGSFSGSGAIVVFTVRRVSDGLTRLESRNPALVRALGDHGGDQVIAIETGALYIE